MGLKPVSELKNKHKDKDIYVLGSGPTLNFIDKEFFKDKITVSVNEVGSTYLPTTNYIVTKYHSDAQHWARHMPDVKIVCSYGNTGANGAGKLSDEFDNLYEFEHNENRDKQTNILNEFPVGDNHLVVSWSSITSAIHLAAHLGAKNIILVAHDCGELDDKAWVDGYVYDTMFNDEEYINNVKSRAVQFEAQTIQLKQKLQEVYKCNIYSLNPFINYSLEGHKYRGTSVIN